MRVRSAVVLEANHDHDWLRRGTYSANLKRRISSRTVTAPTGRPPTPRRAGAPRLKDLVLANSPRTTTPDPRRGTVHGALRGGGHGESGSVAIAGHPTPWIDVEPLSRPPTRYRYDEKDAAGKLFGIE